MIFIFEVGVPSGCLSGLCLFLVCARRAAAWWRIWDKGGANYVWKGRPKLSDRFYKAQYWEGQDGGL